MSSHEELPLNIAFAVVFLDGYFEAAPAEVAKHWRTVSDRLIATAELAQALLPFADFAGTAGLPDDFVITMGSAFAKHQLTAGDCRRAASALEAAA